jgi:hypothetical protein
MYDTRELGGGGKVADKLGVVMCLKFCFLFGSFKKIANFAKRTNNILDFTYHLL